MSEQQQEQLTPITYITKEGVELSIDIPGTLTDEQVMEWVTENGEEVEISAGLREPGFGPFTMGAVPTESVERGFYGARQVGNLLGTELGLVDQDTASEDIAKMERYKQYSREQARREDFASGDLVTDPMTGRQVREGELEYYRDEESLQKIAGAETFSDAISALADNPGAILPIIGESLGLFAPALAGTVAVGVLTGGYGVPGIIATALTGGLGSGAIEYGSSFLHSFAVNGVDVSDDEQVIAALNDETKLDAIREEATKRGIAIGAFDAATIGFAGKLTSLIKGAPLSIAASEASGVRRVGAGTAEALAQAVGGGGGEAAAQALTGKYKPGEIVIEAVAEIPTALPEVALGARATRARRLRNALVNNGYTDQQIEQFGSMSGNEQNKILKELREGNVSTTFPSQRQIDREAEEVSTEAVETAQKLFPESAEVVETTQELFPADTDLGTAPVQETPTVQEASPVEEEVAQLRQIQENQQEDIGVVSEDTEVRFQQLADNQHFGLPERKMEAVQFTNGGGVLNFVVEHVGDLTHRMAEKFNYLNGSRSTVQDKVDKTLRHLERPYGFEKEHQENLEVNHRVRAEKNPDYTFEEHKAAVDQSLNDYADEHAKLEVYNRPQYLAREAAVALGRQDFDRARYMLNNLKKIVDDPARYDAAVRQDSSKQSSDLSSDQLTLDGVLDTEQKPEHVFIQKSPLQEELERARSSTSTDLKQDEVFVDLLKAEAVALGVPEDKITAAVDKRIDNLVREAAEEDHAVSDPDSMAAPATGSITEEQAIRQTNNQLAESGGTVTPTLADRAFSQGEYNEFGARTAKDLNWFARWWNFPDVMAERYPAFAPFWNAVNLQRQVTSLKLTDYMMPMADPLKKLKTTQSQLGVAQALELLDQMGKTALPKYATNGKLDPSKMRDPANPDQYILVNEGGTDVKTTLTKKGDKIFLDQDQFDALLGIRESFNKAKADIIAAYNSNFYFGDETTVANLSALVTELKAYTNQEGNVSTDNQEAALQAIKDSPFINTDNPKSIFRTETDPAKLINYINNYRNTLAVYENNPFYFSHQRYGTIAIIVKKTDGNNAENVWVETHKPNEFRKNLLTVDYNQIKNTKKYKEITDRLRLQYPEGQHEIFVKNFDTSFNEYTENVNTDNVSEMLSRIADVQMESLTKEQNEAVTQFLDKARNTLLITKGSTVDPDNFIKRLNTPGWIHADNAVEQMNDTINIYMGKVAGYVANQGTKSLKQAAINQLKYPPEGKAFPKLAQYAERLDKYMNDGYRDVLNLKRLSFHYFLGLNPSSAVVNLTQIPMATVPWLVRFSPSASAQLEVMRALKDAGKVAGLIKGIKRTGTGSVNELLKLDYPLGKGVEAKQLWDDMKIDLQNSRLMSQVTAEQAGLINYGQFQAGKSLVRNAENISSSIFSYVELLNRMSTYIAAHRTYTKAANKGRDSLDKLNGKLRNNADYQAMLKMPDFTGSSDARKFAAFAVDKTQFLMGADNRPEFMRGAIPSVVFQFMQFPVRYLQLIDGLVFREGGVVKNPKERAAALAYMAAFMMMTGGFWSLPLAENAVDLGEFVYKGLYKVDPMIKAELDRSLFEMGMEDPSYFTRGVIPQLANISLTSRTGAGRLLQPDMFSGDFSKTIGPAGSMIFGSAAAAIQGIHNGNYFMAFANMMPTAMYNVMKAYQMGTTGDIKTGRQNRVMLADQISGKQVVPQILGFQPEDVSQQLLYEFNMRRMNTRTTELQIAFGNKIKSNLTDAYRYGILYEQSVARKAPAPALLQRSKKAYKEVAKYMEEMRLYNEGVEDASLKLNYGAQTFKSWARNAAAQAQGIPKPGRKIARQTQMQRNFEMAPYPQKKRMLDQGFQPQ